MAERKEINSMNDIHQEDLILHARLVDEHYEKHYQNCLTRIRDLRKTGKKFCIYEVPMETIFEKHYNFIECIVYIIKKLKANGWQYKYYKPNLIRISWINEELEKQKINDYQYAFEESTRPEEKIIKAPQIMHFGSKSRRDEQLDIRMQLQKQKNSFMEEFEKAKNKKRRPKKMDEQGIIQDFREKLLLTGRPVSTPGDTL